jgi:hypothetical protein
MLTIEFSPEIEEQVLALAAAHPDEIKQIKSRHTMGGGTDLTLMISLAGLLIPAIKDVVLTSIRARQFKSVAYKDLKITGHSSKEIEKILATLRDSGMEL